MAWRMIHDVWMAAYTYFRSHHCETDLVGSQGTGMGQRYPFRGIFLLFQEISRVHASSKTWFSYRAQKVFLILLRDVRGKRSDGISDGVMQFPVSANSKIRQTRYKICGIRPSTIQGG